MQYADKNGTLLPTDSVTYSSGSIGWERQNGKNVSVRRGKINMLDYGARDSLNGTRVTSLPAGSTNATLLAAEDFANGDHVIVVGAGPAHNMIAPAAPTVEIVGTPGSTLREYAIAWMSPDFGWSAASPVVSIANAPDVLTDPATKAGQGLTGRGDWVRLKPRFLDCLASETTNVALSGLGSSDGVSFVNGDIVMLLGQTNAAENGPWAKHSGAWTRPTGFAISGDLAQGMICRSTRGTLRGRTLWQLTTAGPYTLGTTALSFTQNKAQKAIVWHRKGGTGNWEVAGGFLANSYLYGLPVQFNDKGDRPSGVTQFTFPVTAPAAAAVNDLLRTTIASGGGTTSVVLANASQAGVSLTNNRLDHDNTVPFNDALAAAIAAQADLEIPAGNFLFWSNLKIEAQRVNVEGAGKDITYLWFAMGYALTVGDNAQSGSISDLTIQMVGRTLPGGEMISVPTEDSGTVDSSFHGSGLTLRSGDYLVRRVRVANMYGTGFYVRASASEGTNANRCRLEFAEVSTGYGHGIMFAGGDGNAGVVLSASVVGCAGEGCIDASFLGNTWLACHVSGCGSRAYSSRNLNTCAPVFAGCYAEGGSNQPVRVVATGVWLGGVNGAGVDPSSSGYFISNGSEVDPSIVTVGPFAPMWSAAMQPEAAKNFCLPTVATGFVYQCVIATGTRHVGATEPIWPTTVGTTVVDGEVVWQCLASPPRRSLQLGEKLNTNLIHSFVEAGAPKGLNHVAIYGPPGGYIAYQFADGGNNGHAYRWNGFGAGTPRAVGMLHFPSFVQVGDVSAHYRRFGWSSGEPAFAGAYDSGCLFFDISGTGRVYRASAQFSLGSTTWTANTSYNLGAVVQPPTPDGNTYINQRVVSQTNQGKSGPMQPTWGGGIITDGTCEWVRHGPPVPQWEVQVEVFGGAHLGDANATIQVSAGNRRALHVPLTANRTITLSATGATTGELMEIVRLGLGAFTLTIANWNATVLYVFPASQERKCDFRFDGTNWQLGTHARIR